MRRRILSFFVILLLSLSISGVTFSGNFRPSTGSDVHEYHESDSDGQQSEYIPGLVGHIFLGAGPVTSPATGSSLLSGARISGDLMDQSVCLGDILQANNQQLLQNSESANIASNAIITSSIKAGTAFNKLFHNGNPTIWGPGDNEIDALPVEHAVKGDLVFAVNYQLPQDINGVPQWPTTPHKFDRMEIWIPPEFQDVKKENVVASFTNNWGNIASVARTEIDSQVVANHWTRVRINADTALSGLTTGRYIEFGNSTIGDVWVYVRINEVAAPTIAGKYIFKIALRKITNNEYIWLGSPDSPYHTFLSNGVPNWPTLLVKGEIDPVSVEGVVRYGGYQSALYYGQPIQLAGRVRLVGRAIDPYTLAPTGRPVEARGYFNSTAKGNFEVDGVAPGIYDIYASAAGYPESLIKSGVTVLKGQSYHLDCYLSPGFVIGGEVFSKSGTGGINWVTWQESPTDGVGTQDIKIEIYKIGQLAVNPGDLRTITRENIEGTSCTPGTSPLTWSPVSSPARFGDGIKSGWGVISIGFPWPGYGGRHANGFDSDGVGPEQKWQVSSSQSSFGFKFGDEGLYGAPTLLDGHVPQLNATWIDGLPVGSYEMRVFTYGYVQTKADGLTFEHVTFTISAQEWPGNIYVTLDLQLNSYICESVHFHDVPATYEEKPVPDTGKSGRFLYLDVVNENGNICGWKVAFIPGGSKSATIYSRGIRGQTMSYWGNGGGRNYGFESGSYTVRAFMYGYVEQVYEKVAIGLYGGQIGLSSHLFRGAIFNVTLHSQDWHRPGTDRTWKYPDEYLYLQIWKDGKQLTGYGLNHLNGMQYYDPEGNTYTHDGLTMPLGVSGTVVSAFRVKQGSQVFGKGLSWAQRQSTIAVIYYEGQEAHFHSDTDVGYYPTSFESGVYSLVGLTYGYLMQMDPITMRAKPSQVYASKGSVANISIKLFVGTQISLMIRFKHERIFERSRFNSTLRVRILNDKDALVGEWLTSGSINGTSTSFNAANQVVKGQPGDILPADIGKVDAVLGSGFSFQGKASDGRSIPETLNYLPRGIEMANLVIAGLPDPYVTGSGNLYGENGFDRAFDVGPWMPGSFGAPGAPYGLPGNPWYTGSYYVEVDVVLFGRDVDNRHFTLNGGKIYDGWYPPVAGLLYGESCTIDPRTGRLHLWSIKANHIGPYQQRVPITLPSAYLSGGSSAIFELDLLG